MDWHFVEVVITARGAEDTLLHHVVSDMDQCQLAMPLIAAQLQRF